MDDKKILTTQELEKLLSGKTIKLDCGHRATPGHIFSNTIIIHSQGNGKLKTLCHNCGY
jgi:hypothetical protein